jgi:hypothetical protein
MANTSTPYGHNLTNHGLDHGVMDSSQQVMDLGAFVKATVTILCQILGNDVLLNVVIVIGEAGPIPIFLLLPVIRHAGQAGFHLVCKVIHMVTAKVLVVK